MRRLALRIAGIAKTISRIAACHNAAALAITCHVITRSRREIWRILGNAFDRIVFFDRHKTVIAPAGRAIRCLDAAALVFAAAADARARIGGGRRLDDFGLFAFTAQSDFIPGITQAHTAFG